MMPEQKDGRSAVFFYSYFIFVIPGLTRDPGLDSHWSLPPYCDTGRERQKINFCKIKSP